MLVSTDPASNLQDVFDTELNNKGIEINNVPNLTVANFEPEAAAADYKESVIGPYRGKLPDVVIENMEEQLSGSCTVEIAAFNEFSGFITDKKASEEYDHIIFDTAPTGHTLRMLQLPSAWTNFISESTHGASCLGQLSGLEDKKDTYKNAVENLADGEKTTLVLISRPDTSALIEAERASIELQDIGVKNQFLIVNGALQSHDDDLSNEIYNKQQEVLSNMPEGLKVLETFEIPLRPYNITGIDNIRSFFSSGDIKYIGENLDIKNTVKLSKVVDDLYDSDKKVIFTMGKGGVGKTTIAATVAMELAKRGKKVHLTTTDPAAHLKFVIDESFGITVSRIDEKKELEKYQEEVLSKARETMSDDDIAYIEEDLRSPCTQEIAVFRAFAEIVERSKDEVVVIDTAPTGHISNVPIESNMGLGCGNPIAIALLKKGEVVLDLGSGGGFDCFLASRQVGETGFVIGVDMTPDMIMLARKNARENGYNNVEFRLGEIEHLPVADESVDVIISNCVINLSPDKENVFKEAYRVLKAGGRLSISDVVATAELPEEIRKDLTMMTGCIAGAEYVDNIRTMIHQAGFRDIKLVPKDNGKEIVKSWVPDRNIEDYVTSFIIEATK